MVWTLLLMQYTIRAAFPLLIFGFFEISPINLDVAGNFSYDDAANNLDSHCEK